MPVDQPSTREEKSLKSIVAVNFPGGREFMWVAPDSPIACWQVGEAVVFKNSRWRVLGRVEQADSLNLTLGLPD
jgi:hypothetical protein